MRKITWTIAATLVIGILAGCGSSDTREQSAQTTTGKSTPVSQQSAANTCRDPQDRSREAGGDGWATPASSWWHAFDKKVCQAYTRAPRVDVWVHNEKTGDDLQFQCLPAYDRMVQCVTGQIGVLFEASSPPDAEVSAAQDANNQNPERETRQQASPDVAFCRHVWREWHTQAAQNRAANRSSPPLSTRPDVAYDCAYSP